MRCGFVSALTVVFAYTPTSDYDDEAVEVFDVELRKSYKNEHTIYRVTVGDFRPLLPESLSSSSRPRSSIKLAITEDFPTQQASEPLSTSVRPFRNEIHH